jgi:phage terminase large subunit-like protein
MDAADIGPRPAETLARFCPHAPTAKQREFLTASNLEVFFGGAAGGGKSVALLMAALQYVDVPGYAALILRKDTQRLALAGGLIPRSHEWLAGKDEATWNAARRQWSFRTRGAPATITFGYLATPLDKFRYASSEYQLIAFDELTELLQADYLFLFSRLRRAGTIDVPLRMRSASNPGNVGHRWVKQRFIQVRNEGELRNADCRVRNEEADFSATPHSEIRAPHLPRFIPSRIADNPHLDAAEYRRSLLHLAPVERERLLHGDWSVQEQALIRPEWLRYYTTQSPDHWSGCSVSSPSIGDGRTTDEGASRIAPRPLVGALQLELLAPDGRLLAAVDPDRCRRFITVDPAGTSADREKESRGGQRSFTVCQVWDQPRGDLSHLLILRHQVRGHFGYGQIMSTLEQLHDQWQPEQIWIENEKLGFAAVDQLQARLPIAVVATGGKDKAVRAGRLLVKLERGEVFLPQYENSWRHELETEFLSWTGDGRELTDQIDAAAYAAILADQGGPGILTVQPVLFRS